MGRNNRYVVGTGISRQYRALANLCFFLNIRTPAGSYTLYLSAASDVYKRPVFAHVFYASFFL